MTFSLPDATAILSRTPDVVETLLAGLGPEWLSGSEGPGTWSPYEVVGHLVHGERTDWIARARIILEQGEARPFDPFDREAMLRDRRDRPIEELLGTFKRLRRDNLEILHGWRLEAADLARTGTHPDLGRVTLAQLLATWVAHDLDHVAQIARVLAKQYDGAVGPWKRYLRVLADRPIA